MGNMGNMGNYAYITKILLRSILLCVVFSSPAYAYIDPNSALLLLQGLFAAIGAALTFIKKPWQMLAKLFKRNKGKDARP